MKRIFNKILAAAMAVSLVVLAMPTSAQASTLILNPQTAKGSVGNVLCQIPDKEIEVRTPLLFDIDKVMFNNTDVTKFVVAANWMAQGEKFDNDMPLNKTILNFIPTQPGEWNFWVTKVKLTQTASDGTECPFTVVENAWYSIETCPHYKIIVVEKNDPDADPDADPDPNSASEEESKNYINPLENKLDSYIGAKKFETIYWDQGTGLPNDVMQKLFSNPELSLDFKFTYKDVEHEIYIAPGQAVDDEIAWYGPEWLLGKYGEKGAGGEYTVVKDDNLKDLAAKFNTTVEDLLKKNPFIKDKNLIYPGQIIKY